VLYNSLNLFTIIDMKFSSLLSLFGLIFLAACSTPPKPAVNTEPATQTNYGAAASAIITSAGKPEVVMYALGLHGTHYQWGGNSPQSGFDCSGFVRHVYKESSGMQLPRSSYEMSQVGNYVDSSQLQPGDLVFFNTLQRAFSHVGIYVGDNRFIHSPSAGKSVQISQMNDSYWKRRFEGARRMTTHLQ
jgi:cell wall-associated NlpC family hydrolase